MTKKSEINQKAEANATEAGAKVHPLADFLLDLAVRWEKIGELSLRDTLMLGIAAGQLDRLETIEVTGVDPAGTIRVSSIEKPAAAGKQTLTSLDL